MTNDEPFTSLWLVPAEPHRAELRTHIDRLAVELGTPSFEPHVTLASGGVDHAAAVTAIERIAGSTAPLAVTAGVTAHGAERFRAVFIELEDTRLHELAARLCVHLHLEFDPAQLRPHISLLYAEDVAPGRRAGIAAAHSFAGRTLRFDTLVASVPGAGVEDVARWQSTVARRLTGDAQPTSAAFS
jgi:2'-5' RNA ligase